VCPAFLIYLKKGDEMKKIIFILLLFFCVFSGIGNANMTLKFWWVQHRVYENGESYNKATFAMADESDTFILQDVLSSIELYDPNGIQIQPAELGFGGFVKTGGGRYDANNGRWHFDESLHDESWYFIIFNDPLIVGDYHLIVKDKSGNQYEGFANFNGYQSLPQVSFETICAFKDAEGNLIWNWKVPSDNFPSVSTHSLTYATAYGANGEYLGETYVKVPTHMGWAFAPANLLQQLEEAGGKNFKIHIQIRSNDNNNRTYSNNVNWQEGNACNCDVDGDLKTGIVEAIYSLQVAADIR
jgi:hypothetical protein